VITGRVGVRAAARPAACSAAVTTALSRGAWALPGSLGVPTAYSCCRSRTESYLALTIGPVQLHPGASENFARAGDGALVTNAIAGDVANPLTNELEQGTVAQVNPSDVDKALDFVTLATDLLRLFQKKRRRPCATGTPWGN
jgi:hypothetical protein